MADIIGLEPIEKITRELRQLVYELLSPGFREAGLYIADKIKYLRIKNAILAIKKAKEIIENEGVEEFYIEPRNLFPLIEHCSLEENDELIEKWANLIASAGVDKSFTPSYISILSSLSPAEVYVLDTISKNSEQVAGMGVYQYFGVELKILITICGFDRNDIVGILSNLERLGLAIRVFRDEPGLHFGNPPIGTLDKEMVGLTPLGGRFVLACDRGRTCLTGIPYIKK